MTVRIDAVDAANVGATTNARESTRETSISAAFELSGNGERGRLDLNTPLGTTLARARWEPGSVAVTTPQGTSTYADLNAMTRVLLGEELPIAAFFDWLRGRPWPSAPVTATSSTSEFAQLGWAVNLTQFSDAWVSARRAASLTNTSQTMPGVTVRVKLDRP